MHHLELHVHESLSQQRERLFGLCERQRTRPGADADYSCEIQTRTSGCMVVTGRQGVGCAISSYIAQTLSEQSHVVPTSRLSIRTFSALLDVSRLHEVD